MNQTLSSSGAITLEISGVPVVVGPCGDDAKTGRIARRVEATRDLLAALKQIAGGFVHDGSTLVLAGDWHEFTNRLQEMARAAIARAEGR